MKVKIVGPRGEHIYDCEDITKTYYTENTLAFQDAHDNWKESLDRAKRELEVLESRLTSVRERAAHANNEMHRAESEFDRLTSDRSLLERLRRLFPGSAGRIRDLRYKIKAAIREEMIAEQAAQEMVPRVDSARQRYESIRDDEVTPGVELAMRSQHKRKLVKAYIPEDGDAAYIMNDEGKTIDIVRWPLKVDPVVEMEKAQAANADKEGSRQARVPG